MTRQTRTVGFSRMRRSGALAPRESRSLIARGLADIGRGRVVESPRQGYTTTGEPIAAMVPPETVAVPEDLTGTRTTYALRVRGQSMVNEQICDGDIVIVEDRKTAENGEMVIALLDASEATLKTFHREDGRIRLQPANPTMRPIVVDAERVTVQGVVIGLTRRWKQPLMPASGGGQVIEIPLQGNITTGEPIAAMVSPETVAAPADLAGTRTTYALRVRGQSMLDEQIRDGDILIVEDRKTAENGEVVIALLDASEATLKTFHREDGRIRLQPANPTMRPIVVDADRVRVRGVVLGLMRRY